VPDPVGTVTGAVNGAKDAGDQVVGGAKDAAGAVVDQATSTVGGVAGGGGTDPGSGPGAHGGHGTRRATAGPDLRGGSRQAARTATARRTFSSATSRSTVTNSTSGGVTTTSSEPTAVDVGGTSGLAGAIGRVAKRLAFPLALLVLVLAFIVFQHRIDRRDGKLAEAPVGRDVASFS